MKKTIIGVLLFLFAISAQAAEVKIAYIDGVKALRTSDEGLKVTKVLQGLFDEKQKTIDKKGQELRKLDEEIAKQASILNPDAIKEKRDQREKLWRDYQRMIKDSEGELQKKQAALMQDVIKKIRVIVVRIGKKDGYTAIFERKDSGILYIQENADITDQVIKDFNEAVKAGEFKE